MIGKIKNGTVTDADAVAFHECDHWSYGDASGNYLTYDIYADSVGYNSHGGALHASDGHTFYGNVFGGGSGYYPFWDKELRKAVWRRSAGRVWGNTVVDITSGHILTSVYGGNEQTDVMGNSTVNMTGGTLGVPRSFQAIKDHPVTCYLFGGGKGDQRVMFNTWTNVENAVVNISKDAFIFGSVFGGGEDGHVLSDVNLTVKDFVDANGAVVSPFIGNWGNTSFDGNVFGAGRGYSGDALTAGGVGGNTEVNIEGGTMLGSVYGGGRLASVGCYFVGYLDNNYGNLVDDDENRTYGYTTVNIKGGVIGNTIETTSDDFGNYIGGNVFGGSKGRLTKLDNTTVIADWEDLGKVKQTTVNINQASGKNLVIKGHVYGGGEVGCVEQNTLVNIDKGTIGYDYSDGTNHIRQGGDVYGGGMGLLTNAYDNSQVPVKLENAGLVKGNTTVDMSDGFVQRSLYGGGKYGSVGTFTSHYTESDATGFHIVGEPKACEEGTGLAKVLISGGQVGFTQTLMPAPGTTTYGDDFGYVFCGSRGEADSLTYKKANFLAVVDSTYLEISNNALITASAYGGCENGLVLRDTHVKIAGGQIGVGYNKNTTPPSWDAPYTDEQWNRAITAVKTGAMTDAIATSFNDCDAWPYGNGTLNGQGYPNGPFKVYDIYADPQHYAEYWETEQEFASISATDGNTFFGKVYGGGSGYYPIAPGVWRRSAGRVNGNTLVEITGGHILTAVFGGNEMTDVLGTATVNISGGTVGVPRTFNEIKITPTTCHVFGSGLGDTRTRFNTWTNVENVVMNITGGTVFGSVFGGGEDGHVLSDVTLTLSQDNENVPTLIGTYGHTLFDGNVFGGGRGFSGDALTAGSVGGNTEVNIEGGQVLGSVYGGGRLASVGISFVQPNSTSYGQLKEDDEYGTYGYTTVNITGGTIGAVVHDEDNIAIGSHRVSGNVYGGSKGRLTKMDYVTMNIHWPSLAKVKQTEVNIDGENVVIKGDVFGGGEIGTVRDSTQVVVKNGTLMRDLFGGGYGSTSTETVQGCDSTNMTPVMIAGHVYGRTNATVSGGLVKHNVYGGGEFAKVGVDVNHVTTIRESTVSLNGGVVGSHVPSVSDPTQDTLFGGMVYGGGMGILADTTVAMVLGSTYIYDTISNNTTPAHVLGHIHGGGEVALVQKNTDLAIGSAIVGTLANATSTVTKSIPGGGSPVPLYEVRALEGGRVFGGGQGTDDIDYRHAALVMGNTKTVITGSAQINGSVYGGGELASVGLGGTQPDNDKYTGSATVIISGGTIGPLNGSEHNGNVFGGGKGHEDLSATNDIYYATVDSTHVVIKTGANIAGSVFGGGANGRVLGNASTDIQGGTIGTTGLTTWDGNVFGGGRNYSAYNNTTGVVRGNTDIQMSGGTIKANMYGGGRFGSVGMDYNATHTSIDTLQGADHGYVTINITGGTIGGDYVQYLGTYNATNPDDDMPRTGFVFGGGRGIMEADKIDKLGNVKGTHVTVGGTAKVLSSVYGGGERGIVYDSTYVKMTGNAEVGEPNLAVRENMALHRGDVYGGGCGYDSIYNATTSAYEFLHEAGSVKGNARIEMDGSKVYGNIFGACRLTDVLGHASVIISGGEVGWQRSVDNINARPDFGYVYAAGRGEPQERFKTWTTVDSTYAEVSGGHIWSSLNGGGEEGHVKRNTHVVVKDDAYIGTFGSTGKDGNVFGAGRGKNPIITGVASAAVSGNTQVDIQDGTILGSVFGGGNRGSVGVCYTPITIDGQAYQIGDTIRGTDHGYTLVNVSGGTIGHHDETGRTGGNVYGGSRGVVVDPAVTTVYRDMANVKQTEVNITQADGKRTFIMGSVFGGGEDGHVFKDTYVNMYNGQIGGSAYSSSPSSSPALLCSDRYHGNVYGGGRGLDTYTNATGTHYSTTAGVVYGNTNVFIKGGFITRNVYGGGNMSSVGIANEQPINGVYKTGLAKVTITGGTVGVSPDLSNVNGMVFGSAHGKAGEAYKDRSMVKNTEVLISGNAQIKGSVFGSGEDGHTRMRTNVLVGDGGGYTNNGLVIGTDGASGINGNVYGGGRGLDPDESGNVSSTAGIVGISTTTLINNGTVKGSVFGGGNYASVGYEHVLDTLSDGTIILDHIPADFGKATVTVTGNATIGSVTSELENGNVFGSGKGRMVEPGETQTFADLSYVHETEVLVNGNATVYGSVFGGGEDGHVRAYTVTGQTQPLKIGNTHVTIAENATIGDQSEQQLSDMKGNVYGGGRGLDKDHLGNNSATAGVVEGNTKVDILNGTIWRSVFGGGNQSVVKGQKVTNVVNGTIHADVHGGSNAIPSNDAAWAHSGLKTVNIRGGHVMGDVYGCSHSSNDGEVNPNAEQWTSFVNISGGTIDEDVHGAGYAGMVNGSVCVNIGKDAILNAPNKEYNVNYNKPHNGNWDQTGTVEPTASPLVIRGSVYGGSDFYGTQTTNDFDDYDLTGYSLIFIDGTGYNTTDGSTATNYMNIGGGLFGSGTHTESGKLGRHILLKDYGTRSERSGEMTSATRTLTTIQRVNNLVIDHANVNLSGLTDISSTTDTTRYAVMRVKDTLAVINASGLALKGTEEHPVVYMDSIHMVRSMKLASSNASIYNHNLNQLDDHSWYWLGVKDQSNDPKLYYINGTTNNLVSETPLDYDKENVLLFNHKSKLWVRYMQGTTNYYGELYGFFRMRADAYEPYYIEESFAYARPKTASFPGVADDNVSDGGFLSYNIAYNYFTDEGATYTKTKQHPYRHPYLGYRADHPNQEYRLWVDIPEHPKQWYVDGTRGWGHDDKSKKGDQAGLFPDKPKKTVFGVRTYDEETHTGDYGGIVTEMFEPEVSPDRYLNFHYSEDVIYVVGALTEFDNAILRDSITGTEPNEIHHPNYPLRLFRYPGGHKMSNGQYDNGAGGYTPNEHSYTVWGAGDGNVGPGANYGAMLNVQAGESITMQGVVMDGLYLPLEEPDTTAHMIHPVDNTYGVTNLYDPAAVIEPMVITNDNTTLSVGDSTVLMRGYNGTNAAVWYTNPFAARDAVGIQGGAMYVDTTATVNVSGKVYITDNKQYLKIGDAAAKVINCNVYLPTFSKHLYITNTLFEGSDTESASKIGITSPMGNAAKSYIDNTFSPVAEASNSTWAASAWDHLNFYDDLGWFFVNENVVNNDVNHKRTAYYDGTVTTPQQPNPINANLNENTLFFGWTWANIVRANPGTDSFETLTEGANTTIKIKDNKGLAWLISMTSGMNGVGASSTDFSGVNKKIKQTADIDLLQYVWVPIGSAAEGNHKQFAGIFDGQGHLIKNLYIEYIGIGDSIYERQDYGLFGKTYKANVNRTFVVSGKVNPVIANASTFNPAITDANTFNVGGLVGYQELGDVTNSEAAVKIGCPDKNGSGIIAGGLVAKVESGVVHSSMAMPEISIGESAAGPMGGLVGNAANSSIKNSFVNATFDINSSNQYVQAAGLLGRIDGTEMKNCYAHMRNELTNTPVFKGMINQFNGSSNVIDYCYVEQGYTFEENCGVHSNNYTSTTSPDKLGYMYYDNIIEGDTTLVARLNINAMAMNKLGNDSTYAHWSRSGLAEINLDLPVLLLCEFDGEAIYQGKFRSVGTYEGGRALQYGGPVRDDNELDSALTRALEKDEDDQDIPDYLFVYGDVINVGSNLAITQSKVSYHEDVSIIDPGCLSQFANNYVGITFDNSFGNATSTPGINVGLIGMGGYPLPRDWHMFSTPLSNAPLGFDYKGHNESAYIEGSDHSDANHFNNPWKSKVQEFTWLNNNVPGDKRYWMYGWENSLSPMDATPIDGDSWVDGYFPSQRGDLFNSNVNELYFVHPDSDECPVEGQYRYPYGMDLYSWSEPEYHWINFKRNGPNHWHSDTPHVHLDYRTEEATNHLTPGLNVNEKTLISGKGYMAAITKETFMQSHGYLNSDVNGEGQYIKLSNTPSSLMPGWNLVGNPYHGYLDFQEVAVGDNLNVLSADNYISGNDEGAFYVVYNADKYTKPSSRSAFRYYPKNGSVNGDYAERYLHPHQGFYVKAKGDLPLRFTKNMLSTRATVAANGEESHLRDERPAYPLVNLYLSSDQGCSDVTVIEFERPEWGGARKMKELRVGDGVFYAQHDDTHYAALFAQQGVDRVPLWFEAKEDDIFNIKWNTANGDFHSMYLIDNLTGVRYDMIRNNSYTFEGHKGDYPSRFLIVFNVTDLEENIELDNFVFFDGLQWIVTGNGVLQFIDLNGQILLEKNVNGGQTRVNVPEVARGMYMFRLTNAKETKVQKVIVNR